MTEMDTELQSLETETYSRRDSRSKRRKKTSREQTSTPFNQDFKTRIPKINGGIIVFWSLIVSALSVANPFLVSLATNLQSQSLYAGFAMQSGQKPYGDFFATSGILYYFLTWLGSFFGTRLGLGVLLCLSLIIAGIYVYKIVGYFSQSKSAANQLINWFYVFLLALAFGGIESQIFALPVVLAGLWFLVRVSQDAVRDEGFIVYGFLGAVTVLIDPNSALLWIVSIFVLGIFNIFKKRKARGFYQFLSALFGFLLLMYSLGYYTLVSQILGSAIQQTLLYHLGLQFTGESVLWISVIAAVFLLTSGFLKGMIQTVASLIIPTNRCLKVLVLLTFLVQLIFVVGSPVMQVSQLVLLLPCGFTMMALQLDRASSSNMKKHSKTVRFQYLKSNWFLPLVICCAIPIQPTLSYIETQSLLAERTQVADYIRENSDATAKIYAWDTSAQIYLTSQRLSSAKIITAEPYLDTTARQQQLVYDLNKNQASYIVVNHAVNLLDDVRSNLEKEYDIVDLGTSRFTLYRKK